MKTARDGLAELLVTRHAQLREAAKEIHIADDIGLHAANKCREALDDACGLLQNHMSQCRVATAVASMVTVTALREAVLAAQADNMPAAPDDLLYQILQGIHDTVRHALAKEGSIPAHPDAER